MSKLEVEVIEVKKQTIYGIWKKSNDKSISKDIKNLSTKYHSMFSTD